MSIASMKGLQALGRLKKGKLNQTEQAYETYLESMRIAGEIKWYMFEGLKFRLADKTFNTPDFTVMNKDSELEAHEVKGYWLDDARVKIKVVAERFPVRFIAVKVRPKREGGGWEREVFE